MTVKLFAQGWGFSSVTPRLPCKCNVLSLIPGTLMKKIMCTVSGIGKGSLKASCTIIDFPTSGTNGPLCSFDVAFVKSLVIVFSTSRCLCLIAHLPAVLVSTGQSVS